MRRYATTFDYLHASLVANLAIYRNALEELLNPLMLPSSQMFRLLEDNDDQAWNDEELVVGLKDRLGSSYLPFRSSVKQLHKKVNLLGHKLHLDTKLKVSFSHHVVHLLTSSSHRGYLIPGMSMFKPELASSRIQSTGFEGGLVPTNTNNYLHPFQTTLTASPP
jgi:hypothetical protein